MSMSCILPALHTVICTADELLHILCSNKHSMAEVTGSVSSQPYGM